MAKIPKYGIGQRVFWQCCRPVGKLASFLFPISVQYRAPVPRGPVVAAVNHLSFLDPPVAGHALRRPVRFLALDELWGQSRLLDGAFTAFGSIPLPRVGRVPLAALREGIRHLKQGRVLGVFPEGRRVASWGEEPFKRGAAWLSLRVGAPVVPVVLWGTQNAMPLEGMRLRLAPIQVVVCPPIFPGPYVGLPERLSHLTETIHAAMDREMRLLQE